MKSIFSKNQNEVSDGKTKMIYSLGKLDWTIYDCISSDHLTDEVIITNEQLLHIKNRHPEACDDILVYIRKILESPDYIIRDRRPDTGLVVKKVLNNSESMLLVLKMCTQRDKIGYKNSIITGWKITEKRLNNYLRNKEVIYKKE